MTDAVAGITVAGRVFRPVTSRPDGKVGGTQYGYVMNHIWAATDGKIDEALPLLMARISRSDLTSHILAGLYVEEEAGEVGQWNAKDANANARFFAMPHTFEDNASMNHALMKGVADFFPSALGSTSNFDPASTSPETRGSISGDPMTSSAIPSESSDPSSGSAGSTTLTSTTA